MRANSRRMEGCRKDERRGRRERRERRGSCRHALSGFYDPPSPPSWSLTTYTISKYPGCSSMSSWDPSRIGRPRLSYEFAAGPSSDLHVRVSKNSGGGYFSDQWVQWTQLQGVLDKHGAKPITCHTLSPPFKGQSVNTPGFSRQCTCTSTSTATRAHATSSAWSREGCGRYCATRAFG